jgi:hypothetical protein
MIADIRLIFYLILFIECAVLAYIFLKTTDGWSRKLMILKNIGLSILFLFAAIRGVLDIYSYERIGNLMMLGAVFVLVIIQSIFIWHLLYSKEL